MASKAFGITAYYDAIVSNWFNQKLNIIFPEKKLFLEKKLKNFIWRNPHQNSSIYINDLLVKKQN